MIYVRVNCISVIAYSKYIVYKILCSYMEQWKRLDYSIKSKIKKATLNATKVNRQHFMLDYNII